MSVKRIKMVKGLFRRDIKKHHIVEKVIEKNGRYFVELPEVWCDNVEYVIIYKVLKVK